MNKYEIIGVCNGGLCPRQANSREKILIDLSKALGYSQKNELYLFFKDFGYVLRNQDFGSSHSHIFNFVASTENQVFKMLENFLYENYRLLQQRYSVGKQRY